MTVDMKSVQQYLVGMDRNDLAGIRNYVNSLIDELADREQLDIPRRPHLAMPERRGERTRYDTRMPGHCWDAIQKDAPRVAVEMINFSHTGCRMRCNSIFAPAQILIIEFHAPSNKIERLYVQVVRVRKFPSVIAEDTYYELGCLTIDEKQIEEAQQDIDHHQAVRDHFDHRQDIRILQLVTDSESCPLVCDYIQQKGYQLRQITSTEELNDTVNEFQPHLLVCSAQVIQPDDIEWLRVLRRDFPELAFLAIADSGDEYAHARSLDVEQVVLSDKLLETFTQGLERALYSKQVWEQRDKAHNPLKVLVASSSEKHSRRLETLLLQENYIIFKVSEAQKMIREVQLQQFHIVIVSVDYYQEFVEALRNGEIPEDSARVIVVETDDEKKALELLTENIDLILSPSASRKNLIALLEEAYHILMVKTFVN